MDSMFITTGDAIRILECALSDHTFRDKFKEIILYFRTPGGHYRWLRSAVEEQAARMGIPKAS